jgi:hypothetical protein
MKTSSKKTRRNKVSARSDEQDQTAEALKCYENQPNINMVIPWIYEIAKNMSSRDSDDDEVLKGLRCYESQPNINMTIPWIYQIYKSVKSGGSGGGGSEEDTSLRWVDETIGGGE